MLLICTSCFALPTPGLAQAAQPPDMLVCPEGHASYARSAEELHCDRCGHPVHFDPFDRLWDRH